MKLSASIELNGHEIIEGDRTSIAVTFNNLSGKNFQNPRPWESGTHTDYLTRMANDLHVIEWKGELVRREEGRVVERFDFKSLGRVSTQTSGEAA